MKTKLRLSHSKSPTHREITHFWYNTWPDHGVPRSRSGQLWCSDLLKMLDDVRDWTSGTEMEGAPVVVHCSAGIGRTGTYIGLDACTKLLSSNGSVDVVKVVNRLRDDRGGLVQHAAQLSYLHTAVTEWSAKQGVRLASVDGGDGPPAAATESSFQTEVIVNGVPVRFADIDGDGEMSLEEALQDGMLIETFRLIDADGNGSITKAEFRGFVVDQARIKRQAAKALSIRKKRDSAKARNPGMKNRPSVMNGELALGLISIEGQLFRFIDLDGDGEMDLNEAKSQGMTKAMFDLIDADGNGVISKAEFRAFQNKSYYSISK